MTEHKIQAPFPWFGGKSKVAHLVWERFGHDIYNYVEPFFGSGAVLLNRRLPDKNIVETVNDLDGFVANFWRAIKTDPEKTAYYADNPVNENDLHARHICLVNHKSELQSLLEGDPDFCDFKIAGYWVWGVSCWIGSGFCSGKGSWISENGKLIKSDNCKCYLGGDQGISRQLIHINRGKGIIKNRDIYQWFSFLSNRLKNVRVASGNWYRVCGKWSTFSISTTGVFLDPPYTYTTNRTKELYNIDSALVAHDVKRWALENGNNPKLRIALCGYEGEHDIPEDWECVKWKGPKGYGGSKLEKTENRFKERIWFSPHCLKPYQQRSLFND